MPRAEEDRRTPPPAVAKRDALAGERKLRALAKAASDVTVLSKLAKRVS